MKKSIKIVVVVFLASILVLIRMFEDSLFYDPLLNFFKTNHSTQPLPEFDTLKLLGNIALRFLMNTVVSILILWIIFRDKGILKLSAFLYILLFVILFVVLYFLLQSSEAGQHMTLFYVRRFLIQPLFLLILLPAFYFQQKK